MLHFIMIIRGESIWLLEWWLSTSFWNKVIALNFIAGKSHRFVTDVAICDYHDIGVA